MAKNKHTHYDAAEARILRNDAIISAVMASDGARFDSAEDASVFFARELDYVKTKSYDVQYPELTALTLFPISHEADAGAETVTYYTYDKSGIEVNGERVFLPLEYVEVVDWESRLITGKERKKIIRSAAVNYLPARYHSVFAS